MVGKAIFVAAAPVAAMQSRDRRRHWNYRHAWCWEALPCDDLLAKTYRLL